MYHYSMIMVKTREAAALLEQRGYQKHDETYFLKGWDFYYNPERTGYYGENNGVSVVGAQSMAFSKEGRYPDELSASDYRRALRKESEHIESVILKIKEADFAEKAKLLAEYYARNERVRAKKNSQGMAIELSDEKKACLDNEEIMLDFDVKAKLLAEYYVRHEGERTKVISEEEKKLSDEERERLDEEEIMLNREIESMERDKLFMEAFQYTKSAASPHGAVVRLRERQRYINSSNYGMREYRYYRRLFSRLLRYEPCIYFSYRAEEQFQFSLVRAVPLNELRIGDLAMLCSNDVLKICTPTKA